MTIDDVPTLDENWLKKVGQITEKPKSTKKDEE
jgi:hypothetical protein